MARKSNLSSPAKILVLNTLKKAKQPKTAYEVLGALKPHGVHAAQVVYRALDTLMGEGLVHRVNAHGTFVACSCDASHNHSLSVLTVCGSCTRVEELHNHDVIHQLEGLRAQGIALQRHAVIELPITCETCAA